MKRILVYRYIDIEHPSDYRKMIDTFAKRYGGACPNFGNKVWYQGIISEISTEQNEISYYNPDMSADYINQNFDLLLYPMANIFSIYFVDALDGITAFIRQLTIPVFIISCGVQAKSFDELDGLISRIGDKSKAFIQAVYDSGGDFALRGHFTAAFFEKLGFHDLNVVGCPSLFQLGNALTLSNEKVPKDEFKVAINGVPELAVPILNQYDGLFYDQDILFHILYDPAYYANLKPGMKGDLRWLKQSGFKTALPELILSDRIRLLADVWDWDHSLTHEGLCFSFGTRIHGNIIAILAGLPTIIVDVDARVREMAELYHIPHIPYSEAAEFAAGKRDLYDLYLQTDYTDFNKSFPQLYKAFSDFLVRCHIVDDMINTENRYWNRSLGQYPKAAIPQAKQRAERVCSKLGIYKYLL